MSKSPAVEELSWEVLLPAKRRAQSWGMKPRGTLLINEGHKDEERVTLPKTVATLLLSKQKAGEVHPSTSAELKAIVEGLSRACARTRIERLIDRREYTSQEVKRKLSEDGYDHRIISECVEYACEIDLISNSRFAEAYIQSKIYAGWGMGRIARELAHRGIKVEDLKGWPYDYLDPDDETKRAIAVAQGRRVSGPRAFPKLVQFLYGRGYTTAVAVQAARHVLEDGASANLVDF